MCPSVTAEPCPIESPRRRERGTAVSIGVSINLFLTLETDAPPMWDASVFVHREGRAAWVDSTGTTTHLRSCLEEALRIARGEVASKQLEHL